jgi:Membrane proteins related to metalloendopeptidases
MDFSNNTGGNKILSGVVYIILALCVVTIMCIAIFTVANTGKNNKATPESGQIPVIPEVTTNREKAVTEPVEVTTIPPAVESGKVNNELPEPPLETERAEPTFEVALPIESLDEIVEVVNKEFVMPVRGYITKGHHDDMLVYSLTMNDYRVHTGIDIGVALGDPVYACSSGTIESIYDDPFMGRVIVIDHGNGLKSHYMNLSENLPQKIEENAKVVTGQVIAGVGETSLVEMADTMHLHFEMSKDGLAVDPLEYIEYTAMTFYEDK